MRSLNRAMFQAAQVALKAAGATREEWSHHLLQANFTTELIHRRKVLRSVFRDYLSYGLRVRHVADYSSSGVRRKVAQRMVHRATSFVTAVRRKYNMSVRIDRAARDAYRELLGAKLTELVLYAKELCPEAVVEAKPSSYEDEDGHVNIYPPPSLPEEEVERVELAVAAKAGDTFEETGLLICCAAFD